MKLFIKRTYDLLFAGLGLIILSPLLGFIAIAIWIAMGRPILYKHQRPGLHGKPFVLYKFRTMTDVIGDHDDERGRITPLGHWLRKYSLDELPQLWNVLKGDLSIVGPRPLMMEYLPLYNDFQARRHEVKPGITGWAQVNGRNAISWEQKFAYDVWYVDHWTVWLDMKILWMTVGKVFRTEGISMDGYATMPLFTGTDESSAIIKKSTD